MQNLPSKILGLLVCLALAVVSNTAYAQSDVTQPGDPVIASSSNSPGSEGVANAIDNTQAKYLNFDTATDNVPPNAPSGFAVSPSVGVTRVIGMTIQSANDAPARDPSTIVLEGCNDSQIGGFNNPTNTWEFIAGLTNIPAFTARFETQTFFFDNFKAYRHYRWTVLAVATANDCCMQVAEVELLGSTLPPDVTQPGDPIIASSSNSPGSEGVANAIDNTQAKYLNFDTATDNVPPNAPSGFAVTPSIGSSLVTGMTIQSANDAPARDPSTIILEGSNDDQIGGFNNPTNTWVFITGLTNIPVFTARFETQTFLFDNFIPYKHYRWTVLAVATANDCCMQVAEVELLGTSAPKDVTQPSDPIVASSSNSPGSEGVANAIDNTQAKYLNFDTATDNVPPNAPSGFAVTPQIGPTVVTGMTIQSANDAPARDPSTVILEGCNDSQIGGFNNPTNTWEFIVGLTNIPAFTARFETQEFYFPTKLSYRHYRWTVLAVATANDCCMQVAEVELLAATQSNPCGQTAFTQAPVDTPALVGSPATFLAKVNGPWTVQWLKNNQPIPGANQLSYSTPPMKSAGDPNLYSLAIVGCQTSQVVRATIFTPASTKSIGINFRGEGANGTPTYMLPDDIAGVQLQAYWNNATNGTGTTGDGASLPDAVVDSDNQPTTITVDFASTGEWGAGVGTDSPLQRMLNGLIRTANTPGTPGHITFGNVPAGNHSVLVYMVGIPLQFQNGDYWITGATSVTNYVTVMNADQYKPAPGFYRGSSTNPNARTLASFVRFDNVQPLSGAGTIELDWDTATVGGGDRGVPVNGIQLILNAPNPGTPPAITVEPQPTVAPTNGTAVLTVTATGNNLTYQWRKNGVNLPDGGHISGATTSSLTISSFADTDAGIYSVAVFNSAGSVISKNASVRISKYNIQDALAGYWKLDETSGTLAANAVSGGLAGNVNGTAAWVAGQIGKAFSFDGATFMIVSNYTKATKGIAASAWVNLPPGITADVVVIQNAQPTLTTSGGTTTIHGQFELRLAYDINTGNLNAEAAVGIGPNVARATATTAFPTGAWHHLAGSADGAQLRLYVDGQEVARADYLANINPPDIPYLSIGAALNLTDPLDPTSPLAPDGADPAFMTGPLDDVAVWTRALTASEVSAIYAAGQQHNALTTVIETPPSTPIPITVAHGANSITLSWGAGFKLQSTGNLTPPIQWTDVPNAPSSFTANTATGTQFYRLISTP